MTKKLPFLGKLYQFLMLLSYNFHNAKVSVYPEDFESFHIGISNTGTNSGDSFWTSSIAMSNYRTF